MVRRISRKRTPAKSITCPKCHRESFNLADIEYKYCGKCGWHSDIHTKAKSDLMFINRNK